ncbi:MAG: recombination mediator RecR [Bacteroidota bacterium]
MKIPSKHLEKAVEQLNSLPGIGKRTALRMALQLLNRSEDEIRAFSESILEMKINTKTCSSCGNITDQAICEICSDERRDHALICVVEDIRDVLAFESIQSYKGIYHVLGGVISPMDGIGPSDLNIQTLLQKAATEKCTEIILALSPTMEGDTTNFYLYKKLNTFNVLITALSRGVSVGTELQYADELTLSRSIINRQVYQSDK